MGSQQNTTPINIMTKQHCLTNNLPIERDRRLDVIRGICALGIVGIHFAGSFIGRPGMRWEPSFFLGLYWNQIFTFAVPVFIFISGFLIGKKEYPSAATFYVRRLTGIIPQYFLVCVMWWFLFPHAGFIQDLTWDNILVRLFYRGIQGTQYFVSAILQLFLLAPIISWVVNYTTKKTSRESVFIFAGLLLVLHILLGLACYKGKLNYYYYCLPFSPFWLFFFFIGLYADKIIDPIQALIGAKLPFVLLVIGGISAQVYNLYRCSTPAIAGVETNIIPLDYAYSRPSMLIYDLCIVCCLALLLVKKSSNSGPKWLQWFGFFGKYSYEIYLWHLILLQFIGWGSPRIMQLCENNPIAIIAICIATCIIVSTLRFTYDIIFEKIINKPFRI